MNHISKRVPRRGAGRFFLFCALAGVAFTASARNLHITVVDATGRPLANAAIMARWPGAPEPGRHPANGAMTQQHRHFVPHVLMVPQYTAVAFPNLDRTRHHVYSFSRAKTFDIKLYHGRPKKPIHFDTPGVVTLGCNIHDQMRGYIVVTAAPRWALTDTHGRALLHGLPDSAATLSLWHPWMASEQTRVKKTIAAGTNIVRIGLDVTAPPAPKKRDGSNLQNLFNKLSQ